MRFEDGSVATLTYTALGSGSHPKETMETFVDGRVIVLDDYRQLATAGTSRPEIRTSGSQKGHREGLVALVSAVRAGGEWPIPLWQQVQATEVALRVNELITGVA
jgi:hypothetical protein